MGLCDKVVDTACRVEPVHPPALLPRRLEHGHAGGPLDLPSARSDAGPIRWDC
jgi:hypothetical protein